MKAAVKKQRKTREGLTLGEKLRQSIAMVPDFDPVLLGATFMLAGFGTIMILSTKLGESATRVGLLIELIKQLGFLTGSYCIMNWLSKHFNGRMAYKSQMFCIALYVLALIAVQVLGISVNGSKAWLNFFGFSLQPSEFGKPLLIFVLAAACWIGRRKPQLQKSFWQYFKIPLILMAISLFFLFFLQKDLGSLTITMLIGVTGMLIPRYPGLRKWQRVITVMLVLGIVSLMGVMIFSEQIANILRDIPQLSHVAVRIENAVNPYLSVHDSGYQPANALYAIADSGFFGKGLGASVRKYGFLTQASSDYVLAVVIEETGIFGLTLITAGYAVIIYRLLYWSVQTTQTMDRVVLISVASYFALHFFINVGGVGSLIPMTGVPLLLISAGGSSLMAVFTALGLAQARIAVIKRKNTGRLEGVDEE